MKTYRLKKINLSKLDSDEVKKTQVIIMFITIVIMFFSFFIKSSFIDFITMIGCATVLVFGFIDYKVQKIKDEFSAIFDPNNYFWVFNTLIWISIFIRNLH